MAKLKENTTSEKIKDVIEDIVTVMIKKATYPGSYKDIERKHKLPNLYIETYVKYHKKKEIQARYKERLAEEGGLPNAQVHKAKV